MKEQTASRTAYGVAMRRAAHQLLDTPRIMEDAIAVRIVGGGAQEIMAQPQKFNARMGKAIRAFLVARSRFAEEQFGRAVQGGTRQYVILGAGLDTSGYRGLATQSGMRVFEVDHAMTQKWKKERLERAGIAVPENLQYVAVDFEKQGLAEELQKAGFSLQEKSFVSWLGVVPYLTREAAGRTLDYVQGMAEGSVVVFDYAVARTSLGGLERVALYFLRRRVARAGEPLRLFFEAGELDAFLREHEFSRVEQVGMAELNEAYFAGRVDNLRVKGGLGRIAVAWV